MHEIVVAAGVIVEHGRILLTQRRAGGSYEFMWESPGGKREESDDSLEAALVRELREELGTDVEVTGPPIATFELPSTRSDAWLRVVFLPARVVGMPPMAVEAMGLGWFTLEALRGLAEAQCLTPANAGCVLELMAYMRRLALRTTPGPTGEGAARWQSTT